ncbi:MAG TPA: ABC transporter ATP-binding protein, partial [Miltoncostaeaceae bacterium]|nr:ABC transporter ATP-binding protein [Miltoncostaeaceae bacterium]
MSGAIIETVALGKRFGARPAVEDVSLRVPRGTCFGFLGPNGAGKTTLIRLLLGLARPTSGEARVRGVSVVRDPRAALDRVGGIVEEPRFYPFLSGRRNLEAWAALMGPDARARIPQVLTRVGLHDRAGERVGRYSMGMRQRLGVARALLNDPELLVLDEPSNGLDPAGMAEFRSMIRALVDEEGRTVFLSSHLLDEVQRLCDHVAIVAQGRVVAQGAMQELLAGGVGGVGVDCDDPGRAREVLQGQPGVSEVRPAAGGGLLAVGPATREAAIALNRALVSAGVGVARIGVAQETLEQRYLALTSGAGVDAPLRAPGT